MGNPLIGIAGICDLNTISFTNEVDNFWTEISIPERLNIPDDKPDIEQIAEVNVAVKIIRKKVVVTPATDRGPNFAGKVLSGRKLIIEGKLCQTVAYAADRSSQPLHSVHFEVPFSAYIVVPKMIKVKGREKGIDSLAINYQINACLEDVFVKEIGKRQIFKNVMLLLQAVPVATDGCLDTGEA